MPINVFSHGRFVAFRYDREDCTGSHTGQRKCDVIVCEIANENNGTNSLWLVEIKRGNVDYGKAQSALTQICSCESISRVNGGWVLKKAVVGDSFRHEGVTVLRKGNVIPLRSTIRQGEPNRELIEAINRVY